MYHADGENYGDGEGAIIGIKADGSLCCVASGYYSRSTGYTTDMTYLRQILNKFSNVKALTFIFNNYDNSLGLPLTMYALTKDGKIQEYKNDSFFEYDVADVCNVCNSFVLTTDGNLKVKKTILKDVVQVNSIVGGRSSIAITRSGSVYILPWAWESYSTEMTKLEFKAIVYNEWIARLD